MERKLFLGANTADGFVGYFNQVIKMYNLQKLYILKGGSGVGKNTFIKKFAEHFAKQPDAVISYFYCSGDPNSLDGAIIENKNIGIIDGTSPHIVDPIYPGVIDEIINLGEFIDPSKVVASRSTLDIISLRKRRHYSAAYLHLAKAREQHQKLESAYRGAIDFVSIDKLLKKVLEKHKL